MGYEGDFETSKFEEDIEVIEKHDNKMRFKLNDGVDSNVFLANLINMGVKVSSFNEILPSLNEIFIRKVEENDNN